MGKHDLLIIGGIILVGGVVIFWKDIAARLNINEDFWNPNSYGYGYDRGYNYGYDYGYDYGNRYANELCDTTFTKYADYYAQRVAEELDKYKDDSLRGMTKLEIKGRALLSYKNDMKKMYELNEGCIVPLEGQARVIFIDIIERLADRMGIRIPSEIRADWRSLVAEVINKRKPKSVFSVTKIAVM